MMQFSDWRRPTGLVRQPDSMRTDYEKFLVRPFTPRFGAELVGLSVNELDGATISLVRDAWMDWKVLVFRDQDITSDEQLAFALQFGQVDHHPYLAKGESEDLSVLDNPLAPPFLESNPPSERSGRWPPTPRSVAVRRMGLSYSPEYCRQWVETPCGLIWSRSMRGLVTRSNR